MPLCSTASQGRKTPHGSAPQVPLDQALSKRLVATMPWWQDLISVGLTLVRPDDLAA